MKKTILIILGVLVLLSGFYFFDYIRVTKYDKLPIIALKTEIKEKQFTLYKALFYKVWICSYKDVNGDIKQTIGSYRDADPKCPKIISFTDGYYENINGIKISTKDYQTITNLYDVDAIDSWTSDTDIENALYVANELEKSFFNLKENSTFTLNNDIINIAIFFDLVEDDDSYTWQEMANDETYYYCVKQDAVAKRNLFAKYQNGTCDSIWLFKNFSEKWCQLALLEKDNSIVRQYADANCN